MYKYEVKCKCGHVGRKNYIVIAFAVIAASGKDAAEKARYFPRVKHDHKDAIISVRKITDEEYLELLEVNNEDGYLHCSNRQEQNLIDLTGRIIREYIEEDDYYVGENQKKMFYKKSEVRNPKKFFKNLCVADYCREALAW